MTGMLESDAVVISDEWAIIPWPKHSRVPLHIPGSLNGRCRHLAMDVPIATMSRERLSQALPYGGDPTALLAAWGDPAVARKSYHHPSDARTFAIASR
jgi:hypothetical protein